MFPPAMHLPQGIGVQFITACDDFFQMFILCLYDLIGSVPVVREVTRSTQLLTCHGLHSLVPFIESSRQLGRVT